MKRSFKYRLYPNKTQAEALGATLETCRRVYNEALTQRRWHYLETGRSLRHGDQVREVGLVRLDDPYMAAVPSHVIQNVLVRLDRAYAAFFRRAQAGRKPGFPRYKSRDRYRSFTYPDPEGNGYRVISAQGRHAKLRLSGVGNVKMRFHRDLPPEAKIKTCTVERKNDKWYACFALELPDVPVKDTFENPVGLDVGLLRIATLSDGTTVDNPRHLRKAEARLKSEQRALSRKKRGSANRRKQRRRVAATHERVANCRRDHLHKAARDLVDRYDCIVVEDLRVSNMLKNHHLAKSIADASWFTFLNLLSYKAADAGGVVVKVDPRDTSQICSDCGERVPKSLANRLHRCPNCGLVMDRDVNAALNILAAGAAVTARGGMDASGPPCEAGTSAQGRPAAA